MVGVASVLDGRTRKAGTASMVGVASVLDGRTGKAGTASMVGVASVLDGRTGKAGTASMVGVASDALDGLLDLAALEAARTDVGARGLAVQEHPHALEVGIEAPLRRHHRVAPVVAEPGLLPADCADLGHGGGV
jgi:hypothetical protein